jgi:hypothetical protein
VDTPASAVNRGVGMRSHTQPNALWLVAATGSAAQWPRAEMPWPDSRLCGVTFAGMTCVSATTWHYVNFGCVAICHATFWDVMIVNKLLWSVVCSLCVTWKRSWTHDRTTICEVLTVPEMISTCLLWTLTSLPRWQEPFTEPCSEPLESISHCHSLF